MSHIPSTKREHYLRSRSFWDISSVCTPANAQVHEDQKTLPSPHGLYLYEGFFHCHQAWNNLSYSNFKIISECYFWECKIRLFDANDELKKEEYLPST